MDIYHGNILYSEDKDTLRVHHDAFILVENGIVSEITGAIPEGCGEIKVTDFGSRIIIPAFSDLHVHAAQYVQRGIGMDLLLSDWLKEYTFPQESRYRSIEYARLVYDAFAGDLLRNGTLHVSAFSTIHIEAAEYLMNCLEGRGISGFVGKVNMDTDSPDYLCETIEGSLRSTEEFLDRTIGNKNVKPILTPRFAPTCSRELLKGLGKLAGKYAVGMQTHIVESKWEAEESVRRYPECGSDMAIYEKYGLMDNGPVLAAHFIYPTDKDISILRAHGGTAVHCPDATVNVIAGIMPFESLAARGVNIALGSDIAAGQSVAIYRQIASAVRLSKLKALYEPECSGVISFENAFYNATKEAGSVFGKTGSLAPGYAFDALVIDDMSDAASPLTEMQSIERFCYCGDDRNIYARYKSGTLLVP